MFRERRVFVTALAVLVLLLSTVAVAEEKKLYPACGGREYTASARAQEEVTLASFPYSYDGVSLDCLAYEVTSLKGGQMDQSTDYCLIQHQTEYAYSLVLRAAYISDSGSRITRDFSIRDMTGGSLTEVTTRMPRASRYSIVFKNLAASERCSLKIRSLVSLMVAPEANTTEVVPTVVALEPRTVYTKNSPRTYLVLDYGDGNPPSPYDAVTLVDYTTSTCANPQGDILSMDYAAKIPSTVHMPGDPANYGARATTFSIPNTYRVCFRSRDASSAIEIAVITAFSGNPAYYELISGQDEEGRVMVGEEATIKFYGHDLDTRPKGDEAKFVWFTDECDSGEPAAGVPLTDNLGPADNYGPNTTYSLWTWTMTKEGAFKVCYKRKAAGQWTEVPSIEDAGPGADDDDSAPDNVPDPTDPVTKEKCAKLTYNPQNPWKKYKSAQVTLASKSVPDTLLATLSKVLCLPEKMITVTLSRSTADGHKNVFLYLGCDLTGNEGVCDTTERLNYFVQMSATLLKEHGITAVVGSTAMFAFDDDSVITVVQRSSAALIFCSLCVLAGGGMAVFAVSRYRERRHHFTQFGLEEDDIDDMYDFTAAPGPATRDHYAVPGAPPPPPARIQNAVIEIEE